MDYRSDGADFNERLVDPVTRWKLLLDQLEVPKTTNGGNSPRTKWKIGATKSRYGNFFYDFTSI